MASVTKWSVSDNPSSHTPADIPTLSVAPDQTKSPRSGGRRRSARDQAPHAHLEQRRDVEGARNRRRPNDGRARGAPETSDLDQRGGEKDRAVAIASHGVGVGLALRRGLPPILELPRDARPGEQVRRAADQKALEVVLGSAVRHLVRDREIELRWGQHAPSLGPDENPRPPDAEERHARKTIDDANAAPDRHTVRKAGGTARNRRQAASGDAGPNGTPEGAQDQQQTRRGDDGEHDAKRLFRLDWFEAPMRRKEHRANEHGRGDSRQQPDGQEQASARRTWPANHRTSQQPRGGRRRGVCSREPGQARGARSTGSASRLAILLVLLDLADLRTYPSAAPACREPAARARRAARCRYPLPHRRGSRGTGESPPVRPPASR